MRMLVQGTAWVADHACGLFLLLASLMMFAMVITRYFFAWSDPSVEILARYLMIWATFLGISGAVRARVDLRFTLLEGLFKPRGLRVFRAIGHLVALCLVVGLVMSGLSFVDETRMFNEVMPTALRWPIWIFHASIPVGAVLLAIQIVARALHEARDDGVTPSHPVVAADAGVESR